MRHYQETIQPEAQISPLYRLGSNLLAVCPICGLDRIASEGETDCQECFERQINERKELRKLDNISSKILDEKILPFNFDGENLI